MLYQGSPMSRGDRIVIGMVVLIVIIATALLTAPEESGCSIRGGSCADDEACPPMERCESRRCVPAPGGPI